MENIDAAAAPPTPDTDLTPEEIDRYQVGFGLLNQELDATNAAIIWLDQTLKAENTSAEDKVKAVRTFEHIIHRADQVQGLLGRTKINAYDALGNYLILNPYRGSGRPRKSSGLDNKPTLAELGVTDRRVASIAKKIARIPYEEKQEYYDQQHLEPTVNGLLTFYQQLHPEGGKPNRGGKHTAPDPDKDEHHIEDEEVVGDDNPAQVASPRPVKRPETLRERDDRLSRAGAPETAETAGAPEVLERSEIAGKKSGPKLDLSRLHLGEIPGGWLIPAPLVDDWGRGRESTRADLEALPRAALAAMLDRLIYAGATPLDMAETARGFRRLSQDRLPQQIWKFAVDKPVARDPSIPERTPEQQADDLRWFHVDQMAKTLADDQVWDRMSDEQFRTATELLENRLESNRLGRKAA